MFFSFFKNRRRAKILAVPFPAHWLTILQEQVGHYAVLAARDQQKLRDAVQIIIAEKEWVGDSGMEMTDTMRVTIAALASILILRMADYLFDDVVTILVSPQTYVETEKIFLGGEATMETKSKRLGEATFYGRIRLSWKEVQENARNPGCGENVVFHEFAHKLDMLNGVFDGRPKLPTNELADRWATVMTEEYRCLRAAKRERRETLLDQYGAQNPVEFFAVATECFFDAPQAMQQEYPKLYELFRDYYRQDPAAWPAFPHAPG
jgi:Mlc titration factor MtfA (ptsG expression regulator)